MPARRGEGLALLADPTRRAIVANLALRPHRPSRLARRLGVSPPALSRQLALLEDAGLIRRHSVPGDRRGSLFTVHPDQVRQILAWLAGTEIGLASREALLSDVGWQSVEVAQGGRIEIVPPKRNNR
jgi:DNA-binding MarR family transcriptional regulator